MLRIFLLPLCALYCATNDNVEMLEGVPIKFYALLTLTLHMADQKFKANILPLTAPTPLHRELCLPPSQCGRGFEHKHSILSLSVKWNSIVQTEPVT
jgi:hypothetical protein